MRAQRAGTNQLIQARLKAYDEAIKAGCSREQAFAKAKAITRKQAHELLRKKENAGGELSKKLTWCVVFWQTHPWDASCDGFAQAEYVAATKEEAMTQFRAEYGEACVQCVFSEQME